MANIIAGRFIEQAQADAAIAGLVAAGFPRDRVSEFFVNSPGQHDLYPIGGDQDKSPGAKHGGSGAAAGAAGGGAVGAIAGAALGPAGAVAGAAVGAYVGSLPGALDSMKGSATRQDAEMPRVREAGMMVAVAVQDSARESGAAEILRANGGTDIERNDGDIHDGDWVDFDPLAPPGALVR